MANTCAKIHVDSRAPEPINIHKNISKTRNSESNGTPYWYSAETGIYRSLHPSVQLPSHPFLDVVSFIFSHNHGGVSALVDSQSGFSLSYPEFHSLVNSTAAALHRMGVSQGDVALLLLPNSIYFPVIFLGLLSVGAVAATMNPLSTLAEIKKQAFDCNVRLAFATPDRVQNLGSALLGIPVIGLPESLNLDEFGKLLISSDPKKLAPIPRINQQDTAAILFSSGTTGGCKAVALTHANFIATVALFVRFEASQYEYPATANVYLDVVPMFHVYGLSLFVVGLLSLGSTVVVMRKYDIDDAVRAIDRYGVTHFPMAPPLLVALTRKAKAAVGGAANCSRLKSLKQVSCGAAPVSITSIQDFVHTFPHIDFIQGYGMTESSAVGTRGFNTAKLRNHTSVGLLAPNMEARVVDWSSGSSLPPNSMGELWLRGPGIMKGYLNNGEASKNAVDEDGWLHTGDIVYFDEDGYLYVHDRLKEMIKYKGFQIAPADLESVLMSHPHITDAAVTSASNEEVGEIPVAFVVKTEGSELSQAAVIDFVAKQVAPYKKVRRVYFTKSIPKSAQGKILRKELRTLLMTSKI
ncbi:PREDICTED: 4-coumarate--CoA ligase-like 6 isoform X1 [Ipomoea nil]|uniref:4-coumarate--CoA ligase-like 6 isoform X1 n=1 Tax=Ipomoea nil TaxID=35883 RepID=UPI000901B1E1|nr:PREDICTED: 4-coumarate--CoA ligase-like 6 isoform X1 [Ipomoea nil]